ncbi:MAG: response regulator [Deltaproteobacteria bacterium]|nr:response regulator [Deltaproteobacteria bacterium]
MKILIVDDARWQRQNLSKILAAAGHEVIQATNGREALEKLSESPAIIVCDLLMPELDGFGFLEELGRRPDHPPVIIASADIQRTSRERCTALGAAAFLAKPYAANDILPLLSSVAVR